MINSLPERYNYSMQARRVAVGHISNHLSLARKLNDFLKTGSGDESHLSQHAYKMEEWLSKLEAQLTASMPRVLSTDAPDINVTWEWVERFCNQMVDQIDWDMRNHGCILHQTAVRGQQALVAAMVTGCYCPPPRLHVLKTMLHPNFEGGCQDPDCTVKKMGGECRGNRLELGIIPSPPEDEVVSHTWTHFDYLTTDISNVVHHHKNDR